MPAPVRCVGLARVCPTHRVTSAAGRCVLTPPAFDSTVPRPISLFPRPRKCWLPRLPSATIGRIVRCSMKTTRDIRRHFASDNYAGICPEAWAALEKANQGHAVSYGDDPWTARAADLVRDLFEMQCEVFFVFNGTAANSLSLASTGPSYPRSEERRVGKECRSRWSP